MGVSESKGSNEMIAQIRYEFMFDFFGLNKNVYNAVCGHFSEIDLSNGAGRDKNCIYLYSYVEAKRCLN